MARHEAEGRRDTPQGSTQLRTERDVRPTRGLPGLLIVLAPSRLRRRSPPAAPPMPPSTAFRGVPMFSFPSPDKYGRALTDGLVGAPSSACVLDVEAAFAKAERARGDDRRP